MQIKSLQYKDSYTSKETFRFFLRFISRAFLISIITLSLTIATFIMIVIGDVYYNYKQGNNVVPLFGGYIIITPSMVPTIKVNDAVIVKRTSDSIIDIGDIITFKSTDERYDGLTVTHRIVGTQTISTGDLVYRTKGDNNRIEDSAVVKKENIYGKVVLKLPKIGYIKDFLRKPIGFILFIICPIVLILLINIKHINNKEEEFD